MPLASLRSLWEDRAIDPRRGQPATALKSQLAFARERRAFVVFRNADDEVITTGLEPGGNSVGRGDTDVPVAWDQEASRLHCEIAKVGGSWVVADDGLSRNGTFVNGRRVVGRLRLADADLIEVGTTTLAFFDPASEAGAETVASSRSELPELSAVQQRLLVALCRPLAPGDADAAPASNAELADALHLSLPGVKSQMRTLFERFGVEDLAHNRKRARLAALAIESGAVTYADLASPEG